MANLRTLKQFRGKSGAFEKQYRVGEDVLVMFCSKEQIFVRNLETEHVRLYHRGMQIKGTYRSWNNFSRRLKRRTRLCDQDIYNLGLKHEIECTGFFKQPILDESYRKVGK